MAKTYKKAKQVRDVKSRYTRFTVRKMRLEFLAKQVKFLDEVADAGGVDVVAVQEELARQVNLMHGDFKAFYNTVKFLHDEMKIHVAELRYIDGLSWENISKKVGLSVATLHNYNKEIEMLFEEHKKLPLIKYIDKDAATQYVEAK